MTNAELLEENTSIAINRPSQNEIKWYYLQAEPGDSLEFKLDYPATIQLFAPSGEEVYRASGVESVKWGGYHAYEHGNYYLAVHDVTSAKANTITVSYNHIDKYAVQKIDVTEVGVAESFIPITIHGNGYDRVKSVSLKLNDVKIEASDHVVINKGKMIAFFSLTGDELLGDYALNVEFDDAEDGAVTLETTNQVHFVTPEWGDLKVEILPYMVGINKTTVKIRVTNQGNVARLYTPLTFAFDKIGVNEIDFDNFFIDMSKDLQESEYNPIVETDNLAGKGVEAEAVFSFIPSIKPREAIDLYMSYNLAYKTGRVNMYATIGKSLNEVVVEAKHAETDDSQDNTTNEECTIVPSIGKYLVDHTDLHGNDYMDKVKRLVRTDFEKKLVRTTEMARDVASQPFGRSGY